MTGDNQDVLEFLNQTKSMYDEDSTNYRMCEQAIAAVMGVEKAAKKLAYIHQCIDLYCDREELHDESYWLDYILDPEWIDTDIGWTGDKMTPNQSETPTSSEHTADVSKKVGLIDRKAVIDALTHKWDGMVTSVFDVVNSLPSAQSKAIRPKFEAEDRYIKNHFQIFPHCPQCNYELETGDCYCRECGCHIDWSEDDE